MISLGEEIRQDCMEKGTFYLKIEVKLFGGK